MGYRGRHGRASRDPRWLEARWPAKCGKAGCGLPIAAGERAFYYPNTGTLLAVGWGHAEEAAREFEAMAFDDAQTGAA